MVEEPGNIFAINNPRKTAADALINMLAATCKPLHTPIECLKENLLYKANDEVYVLGKVPPGDLEKFKELKINIDGWAEIDLEFYLNIGVPNKENITVIY